MSRTAYYEKMRALALEVRQQYDLTTPRVCLSDMRRIYQDQGIHIDLWPHKFKHVRGAYFDDECGPTVMLYKKLPEAPRIFTMGHELKHHLEDRGKGLSYCSAGNEKEPIEIGAEVFAAELIFPQDDFCEVMRQMGISFGGCTQEAIVRVKRETSTTMSYQALNKMAHRLRYADTMFTQGGWQKLEEAIYGVPFYRLMRQGRKVE